MDKVVKAIRECGEFTVRDKEIIIKFIKRYENEPYRSRVSFNPNASSLRELVNIDHTIEGSYFWEEVILALNKNKVLGQIKLDL